jgi:hypothetical protein
MKVPVDIWMRGNDFATSEALEGLPPDPRVWSDEDVRAVLEGMLRLMRRLKHPGEAHGAVALRGLSWIVNPYVDGGVVIAIEITMGAAIAGPLDIDQSSLEAMISRVLARPAAFSSSTLH